jgi:hypothetical protein
MLLFNFSANAGTRKGLSFTAGDFKGKAYVGFGVGGGVGTDESRKAITSLGTLDKTLQIANTAYETYYYKPNTYGIDPVTGRNLDPNGIKITSAANQNNTYTTAHLFNQNNACSTNNVCYNLAVNNTHPGAYSLGQIYVDQKDGVNTNVGFNTFAANNGTANTGGAPTVTTNWSYNGAININAYNPTATAGFTSTGTNYTGQNLTSSSVDTVVAGGLKDANGDALYSDLKQQTGTLSDNYSQANSEVAAKLIGQFLSQLRMGYEIQYKKASLAFEINGGGGGMFTTTNQMSMGLSWETLQTQYLYQNYQGTPVGTTSATNTANYNNNLANNGTAVNPGTTYYNSAAANTTAFSLSNSNESSGVYQYTNSLLQNNMSMQGIANINAVFKPGFYMMDDKIKIYGIIGFGVNFGKMSGSNVTSFAIDNIAGSVANNKAALGDIFSKFTTQSFDNNYIRLNVAAGIGARYMLSDRLAIFWEFNYSHSPSTIVNGTTTDTLYRQSISLGNTTIGTSSYGAGIISVLNFATGDVVTVASNSYSTSYTTASIMPNFYTITIGTELMF